MTLPTGCGDIEAHARALHVGGIERLSRVMDSHRARDRDELDFMRWRDDCGALLPRLIDRWVTLCAAQAVMGRNRDPRG